MSTPGSRAAPLVSDVGERALIERIRGRLAAPSGGVIVGIGDDAAVVAVEPSRVQVLTTDALVEGVHFDRRFSAPADIGYKALAVNLSDVAAMGGTPRFALLSLILPPTLAAADLDELIDGLLTIAKDGRIDLVGGNISQSPGPLVIDVTLSGWVHPRKVLVRGGGRPGDGLYVSGRIGSAAAGLSWLRDSARTPFDEPADRAMADCVRRYRRPEPRTRLGMLLGRNRAASACIDLSDGLADGIRQIAASSRTGARVDASTVPIDPAGAAWFESKGEDALERSLSGGDDYELLFGVPARALGRLRSAARLARGLPLTRIGELTSGARVVLQDRGQERELPSGYAHF